MTSPAETGPAAPPFEAFPSASFHHPDLPKNARPRKTAAIRDHLPTMLKLIHLRCQVVRQHEILREIMYWNEEYCGTTRVSKGKVSATSTFVLTRMVRE